MIRRPLGVLAAVVVAAATAGSPARADDYAFDPSHAQVTFKVNHIGLSWTYGRFNDVAGGFTIDPADPAKCSFELVLKIDGIDTGNAKRDEHLRGPDFFNAKQYGAITFRSTSVKAAQGGYEVTGDLTMHGVTKPVTLTLQGGKTAEFPKGVQRTGYSTELVLKRSEFGVGDPKFAGALGDDVHVAISFEGTKK